MNDEFLVLSQIPFIAGLTETIEQGLRMVAAQREKNIRQDVGEKSVLTLTIEMTIGLPKGTIAQRTTKAEKGNLAKTLSALSLSDYVRLR